jgi:Flp pilus assembly pilin Flp
MGHRALVRLIAAREGTTAVEYAVLVAFALLACISCVNVLAEGVFRPIHHTSQQIELNGGGGVKVNKPSKTAAKRKASRAGPPLQEPRGR